MIRDRSCCNLDSLNNLTASSCKPCKGLFLAYLTKVRPPTGGSTFLKYLHGNQSHPLQTHPSSSHPTMANSSTAGVGLCSPIGHLVTEKLTKTNFALWKVQVLPAISGAQQMGYIDALLQPPLSPPVRKVHHQRFWVPLDLSRW